MMTAEKLGDVLWEAKITCEVNFSDAEYELPRPEFIFRDFRESVDSVLAALDSTGYAPESNDCDNRADIVRVVANILHHRTRASLAGLAFGRVDYHRKDGAAHAANVFVGCPRGTDTPKVYYYDHDFGESLLTPEEVGSIYFCLM